MERRNARSSECPTATTTTTTKKIHPGREFLAGAGGSLCLVIVGHPADTIKVRRDRGADRHHQSLSLCIRLQVRLQTMRRAEAGEKPLYRNAWDCVKQTVKNEVRHSIALVSSNALLVEGNAWTLQRCVIRLPRY